MAPTYQLAVKHVFDRPNPREKRYANHLVHAAWQGSRIILRQTSPESEGIFDFMIQLHKACEGQWSRFVDVDQDYVISSSDLDAFLRYAAQFLAHVGNYHVSFVRPTKHYLALMLNLAGRG